VAIRFKSGYNGKYFDDCFKTQNAYYYRVGFGAPPRRLLPLREARPRTRRER
jgi:hypothetical protein